jgi:LAO/AO transport system ATPase
VTFTPPLRILLAKVGLDGHDRGIKVVARGLRDAGMHVIYAGLWQSPEAVVNAVVDEDVDFLGLSLLSGAHMTLVPRVLQLLQEAGRGDVGVLVGGIIPEEDVPQLISIGVARVFGPGASIEEIAQFLHERKRSPDSQDSLVKRFAAGDRWALARLLTYAANGQQRDCVDEALKSGDGEGRVVAVTGGGGVGKSTLLGKLIDLLRAHDERVAVLACDPQSSLTGGALLGDRIRMPSLPGDARVFIRSVATPAGHSGIAAGLDRMARLMSTFGFRTVLIETVGSGQGDTAIRDVADVVVLLVQPETGDELQWEKAGQMEIADVVVVHKSDLRGAEVVETQLREILRVGETGHPIVLRASANKRQGIDELWAAIESVPRKQ